MRIGPPAHHLALWLTALWVIGCTTSPAGRPAEPVVAVEVGRSPLDLPPGVEGSGQVVRGLGGWEGELVGKPPPGSKFTLLQVGMSMRQVLALIGPPLGRAAVPGPGGEPREVFIYPGQGRLVFVQGPDAEGGRLTWVIHRRDEGAGP